MGRYLGVFVEVNIHFRRTINRASTRRHPGNRGCRVANPVLSLRPWVGCGDIGNVRSRLRRDRSDNSTWLRDNDLGGDLGGCRERLRRVHELTRLNNVGNLGGQLGRDRSDNRTWLHDHGISGGLGGRGEKLRRVDSNLRRVDELARPNDAGNVGGGHGRYSGGL